MSRTSPGTAVAMCSIAVEGRRPVPRKPSAQRLDGQHDDHAGGDAKWDRSEYEDQLDGIPLCAGCVGKGRHGAVTACAVKDGDCEAFIHQTDVSGRRAQVS